MSDPANSDQLSASNVINDTDCQTSVKDLEIQKLRFQLEQSEKERLRLELEESKIKSKKRALKDDSSQQTARSARYNEQINELRMEVQTKMSRSDEKRKIKNKRAKAKD